MADQGFWDNGDRAREVVQQVKSLKVSVEPFDRLAARIASALELDELLAGRARRGDGY